MNINMEVLARIKEELNIYGNIYTTITEMRNNFQKEHKAKITGFNFGVTLRIFSSPTCDNTRAFCEVSPCGSPTECTPLQQLAMTYSWNFGFAPEKVCSKTNYFNNTYYHTA